MKVILVLVFFSNIFTNVKCICDIEKALKCTGYDILSMNPLGLMTVKNAEYLCSILGGLEMCIKDALGGCSLIEKVGWVPAIDSANFICNRLADYDKSSHCYLTKDIFENLENCTQHFHNAASCRAFETFLNCVLTPIKGCSLQGVDILTGLFTAFTEFHFKIMNCSVPVLPTMKSTDKLSSTLKPKAETSIPKSTSLLVNSTKHMVYSFNEVPKPKTATVKNTAMTNEMYVSKLFVFLSYVVFAFS